MGRDTQISQALRTHLIKLGYKFNWKQERIERELRSEMHRGRYEEFCEIAHALRSGATSVKNLYNLFNSAKQVHLAFSHQAEIVMETYTRMGIEAASLIGQGTRVCDLGCGTGALISWLAKQHPEATFCGFDSQSNFISIAHDLYELDNLQFIEWDYTLPLQGDVRKFDVLYSLIGIEELRTHYDISSIDTSGIRESTGYQRIKQRCQCVLSNWHSVASEGAVLFLFLRIPDYFCFVSVIDAAEEAGWTWLPKQSEIVAINDEKFPYLRFQIQDNCKRLSRRSIEEIIGWWTKDALREILPEVVEGAAGLLIGNMLIANAETIEQKEKKYPDGHTMQVILGSSGHFCFLLKRATTCFAQLKVLPKEDMEELVKLFTNPFT